MRPDILTVLPTVRGNFMRLFLAALGVILGLAASPVGAQTARVIAVCGGGSIAIGRDLPALMDPAGDLCVTVLPKVAASVTIAGCTVGATSATCLAASSAPSSLTVQNTSATARVACTFGATAILNDSGSFLLAAGQARQWNLATSGVPTNALKCISDTAATPLYVEYN